ncbi:MAG TPA: alpha/beta fold hydrolase [Opitutaceae bacterium]|nr:alpha/beta fold hydrolase [Opitutaceae bacterium]
MAILHAALSAQIEVRGKYEGEWLPIVGVRQHSAYVLKDGKRMDVSISNVDVRPAAAFGPGQVMIDKIVEDLDPLKNATDKEKSQPNRVLFRYRAEVTSQSDLSDCYALLVFVSNGSVGVNVQPIGKLRAGKSKRVEVETQSRVDKVSALHVFAGALEVRSNLVTEPYDARALWAELSADGGGVSAVELCKAEEGVPLALSRDGKFLATTRDRGDHYGVLVYDLASMAIVCEVPADKEYKSVNSIAWVGSNVVFVVDEKLKLLEVATRTCTVLRESVMRIIMSAAQKPEIVTLRVVGPEWVPLTIAYDTKGRRTADWAELEAGWTIFDPNGEPRLRYDFDGARKLYQVRIGTSTRWVPLDATVKQEGLKFSVRGDEMLDRKVQFESLGADGDTIYVSSRLSSDTFQLAAYSLSQGRITRTIAGHPKYDLTSSDYNDCRLLIHRATSEPIGLVYESEKPKVLWFDPVLAAAQKVVEGHFPGQSVLPMDWSDDCGTFIYFIISDRNPGVYYAYRPSEGKLIQLFSRSECLDPQRLAKTTPIDFVARDGVKIHAYLTLPPQAGTTAMPLIVDIHGGPMARDSWGFNSTNQFFATRGYAVLEVNYRGSSGYGAAYQAAGLRARLDTVVLDDIADGVRAIVAGQNIDSKRIAVMGGSFGGWAAYMSLIKYPELYRAGIAIAAVSHFRDMQKDKRRGYDRYAYGVWQDILGRKDFAETEHFIDPLLRAGELHQPIYIMHGGNDWVVDPKQADLMLKALQKHNPNVRSKSFPLASHTDWPEHDRVEMLNESETFLRKYLAPEPESGTPVAATQQPGK